MKWQRVNPGRLFHQAIGRHRWSFWLNSSHNPAEPVDLPSMLMQKWNCLDEGVLGKSLPFRAASGLGLRLWRTALEKAKKAGFVFN